MICKFCGGGVVWKGLWSNLTHTECVKCKSHWSQIVEEEPVEDGTDRDLADEQLAEFELWMAENGYHADDDRDVAFEKWLEQEQKAVKATSSSKCAATWSRCST